MAKENFDALLALKKPCSNCPFRKEGAIELMPGRIEGIVSHLLQDDWATFTCHKTLQSATTNEWDEEGKYRLTGRESMCAGAMVYLQKAQRLSVPQRLGICMGLYDFDAMEAQKNDVIDLLT